MTLFVLARDPAPDDRRPQAADLRRAVAAARESGLGVVRLPWPYPDPDSVLPDTLPGDLAFYCGPLPQHPDHHHRLEAALAARSSRLVNSAAASEQATRIEQWAPALEGLTADTVILSGPADFDDVERLGWPVFVKGSVKSAKEQGWAACVTDDSTALRARCEAAWSAGQAVVARELLALRRTGSERLGFPESREYRVTMLDDDVLHCAPYWQTRDPLGTLSQTELGDVEALTVTTSKRLHARALTVDVGQLDDRSWTVVEVGDTGHTALAHVPPHLYWSHAADRF